MSKYYYYDGRQNVGPITLEDLKARPINPDTLVWYEGLPDWKKASEFPELQDRFGPAPAPAAAQPTATTPAATSTAAQPAGQPQQYNHYSNLNQQQPYYASNSTGSTPSMGALKVFSILGILMSIVLFIVGAGVMDLYASGCWNCDCYPRVRGNEELGITIFILSILFMTFSIIATVKAFKKYS